MASLGKVRIDKWLWATRWFKTRTMATDACQSGKVKVDNVNVKPAYNVQVGQTIQLTKESIRYTLRIEGLLEKRVGAPEAQKCYTDLTPPEEKEKFNSAFFHHFEVRDKGVGRPTKKERRDIDQFKSENDED